MQVGMVREILAPGMQHGKEADFGAEMFRVGSDCEKRFRSSPEENAINDTFVLERNGSDRFGYGKDNVKIFGREKFRLPSLKPLGFGQRLALRAMSITAGVERDSLMPAAVTLIRMTAERSCPAKLDRAHDAPPPGRHGLAMRLPVFCAVAAEDIRHLERGLGHDRRLGVFGIRQQVQGAARSADCTCRHVSVTCCCLQAAMAEQYLNDA